jgi:hypothetical protein
MRLDCADFSCKSREQQSFFIGLPISDLAETGFFLAQFKKSGTVIPAKSCLNNPETPLGTIFQIATQNVMRDQ